MTQYYWYNGQPINSQQLQISIDNPGLLYGATVFSTLRIYQQNLQHPLTSWLAHVERIKNSLNFLDWNQPDWERVRQGAEFLLQYFPVLRVTIFPDGTELITGRNLPPNLIAMQAQGIIANIVDANLYRSLPAHKTGNYLAAWLAKTQIKNSPQPGQEAIFTNERGDWLETSTGNLWGWGDGCFWTPPLTAGILPGILRSHLLGCLHSHNQTVREEAWTPQVINGLETLAYSNCVVELIPIHTTIQGSCQLQYNPHHRVLNYLRRFLTTSSQEI